MNLYAEILARENEGYHTPLPDLVERLKSRMRRSQRMPNAYDVPILDYRDIIHYLDLYRDLLSEKDKS
jgi:hypothetical protein